MQKAREPTEGLPGWIHGEDLGGAFRLAVEAGDIGFEVFHIFADVPGLRWNNAKRLLGFTAVHRLENLRHESAEAIPRRTEGWAAQKANSIVCGTDRRSGEPPPVVGVHRKLILV